LVAKNKKGELNDKTIAEYLKFTKLNRAGVLIVPDAAQLKKGGRVSNFKSVLIKLFGLKLIITLDQHGLLFKNKGLKVNDTIEKAKQELSKVIPLASKTIKRFVIFCNSETDAKFNIPEYVNVIKTMYPKVKIEYVVLPSVITAHVGPNYVVFGADLE
jgi:fatty acid-binding protein DegV